MDFKHLNGVWKLKRFCITCIELIFQFFLSEFNFQFEFFFNFDFYIHKSPSKRIFFEILSIGDYNLTVWLFDGRA